MKKYSSRMRNHHIPNTFPAIPKKPSQILATGFFLPPVTLFGKLVAAAGKAMQSSLCGSSRKRYHPRRTHKRRIFQSSVLPAGTCHGIFQKPPSARSFSEDGLAVADGASRLFRKEQPTANAFRSFVFCGHWREGNLALSPFRAPEQTRSGHAAALARLCQ